MKNRRPAPLLAMIAVVAVSAACAACAAPAHEAARRDLVNDGRDIALSECASCHAVGAHGASPAPDAPVFRTVLSRYRADVLEEELLAGIRVTHAMPDFQFNPQGVDALVAYLRSIQTEPSASWAR